MDLADKCSIYLICNYVCYFIYNKIPIRDTRSGIYDKSHLDHIYEMILDPFLTLTHFLPHIITVVFICSGKTKKQKLFVGVARMDPRSSPTHLPSNYNSVPLSHIEFSHNATLSSCHQKAPPTIWKPTFLFSIVSTPSKKSVIYLESKKCWSTKFSTGISNLATSWILEFMRWGIMMVWWVQTRSKHNEYFG